MMAVLRVKREALEGLALTVIRVACAFAFTCSAAASGAYLGSIVNSWDARYVVGQGGLYPLGVAYHGGYLWLSYGGHLLKRCPSNGSIVKVVHTPERTYYDIGYDSARGYIYGSLSWYNIGITDADTGRLVGSFRVPAGAEGSQALTFSRAAHTPLWIGTPIAPVIWRMTSAGSVVSSYVPQFPCYYINGLAYAANTRPGPVLFAGQRYMSVPSRIFALRPGDGSIHYSFISPLPRDSLSGLTWDGRYLWGVHTVNARGPAYVYQFVATKDVAVIPSSIGRVKAIYR